MNPTKKQLAAFGEILNGDYADLDEAAQTILAAAWDLYQEREKYAVVGRLRSTGPMVPGEPAPECVVLGGYATEGDAWAAMKSLTSSTQTGEQFAVWTIPTYGGSPHDYFKHRKAKENEALEERKAMEAVSFRWRIEHQRDSGYTLTWGETEAAWKAEQKRRKDNP